MTMGYIGPRKKPDKAKQAMLEGRERICQMRTLSARARSELRKKLVFPVSVYEVWDSGQ